MAMAAQQRKPKVIVVGGDERVEKQEWPDTLNVRPYRGERSGAAVDSVKASGADLVIILTRWSGHSVDQQMKATGVRIHRWDRGISELAKNIEQLAGVMPVHPVLQLPPAPLVIVKERPAHYVPAAALELPEPAEEQPQTEPEVEPMPAVAIAELKPKQERLAQDDMLEMLMMEPSRVWTVTQLAEALGTDKTGTHRLISNLIAHGKLEVCGGEKFSKTNPRQFRVARPRPNTADLGPVEMAGIQLARARRQMVEARNDLEEARSALAEAEADMKLAEEECQAAEQLLNEAVEHG